MEQNRECLFSGYDTNGQPPQSILDLPPEASQAEIQEELGREICPREDCHLLGAALLRYFQGDSNVRPLNEIGGQVPEDCGWFAMPVTGERIDALQHPPERE